MKRVLLIDPWGTGNTKEYLNGLIVGLSNEAELTVFTNAYFESYGKEKECLINKIFFRWSENMPRGKKRSILRGIEYVMAYVQILKYLKKNGPFDVIHINWLLLYSVDVHILPKLKKYCKKLVYTAHNVLPHQNGENSKEVLAKIYHGVDKIVLHGEHIRQEFNQYFSPEMHKVFIQKHGANLVPQTDYNIETIPQEFVDKIKQYENAYIFFGNIFYNKGTDRLLRIWKNNRKLDNTLLIVAGRSDKEFKEFHDLKSQTSEMNNIIVLDRFVEDSLLNYLITHSELILLPYRHASMSGVIFTAADFKKPVLATNAGAFDEYVMNGRNGILVPNSEVELERAILETIDGTASDLQNMGEMLYQDIQRECDWKMLARLLVNQCY